MLWLDNMNTEKFASIIDLLDQNNVTYVVLKHEPSKTSDESKAVRAKLGYPNAMGAKALLVKLYFADKEQFATIVLPGDHTLTKDILLKEISGLKKIRFVTPEEMLSLTGLVPGSMPPFATPIFPDVHILIIASAIGENEELGFNIADLCQSVILKSNDYLSIVHPNFILNCSQSKL